MAGDVKNLLDSIIDNTNNSYPVGGKGPVYNKDTVGVDITHNNFHPQTFDKGKFKEKLSMYVLKDLVCAMMHDETTDLDAMIDESIMRHIKNNYNGSCYSYICNARDRLKSPLRCIFDENMIKISTVTSLGTANDKLACKTEGNRVEIGFNNIFLLDALKACSLDEVKITLNGPLSPITIVPPEGDNFLYLVLPVRLKNEN